MHGEGYMEEVFRAAFWREANTAQLEANSLSSSGSEFNPSCYGAERLMPPGIHSVLYMFINVVLLELTLNCTLSQESI